MRLAEGREESWDFDSAAAHEFAHWQQHHATSLGAYLTGLRLSQFLGFLSTFVSLNFEERKEFIRLFEAGNPLVQVASDGMSLAESPYDALPPLAAFRSHWLTLQTIYALFLDGDSLGTNWTLRPVDLAWSLLDVESSYNTLTGGAPKLDSTALGELEHVFSPDVRQYTTPLGMGLSSRVIMEAACVISEAHLSKSMGWFGSEPQYPADDTSELAGRLERGLGAPEVFHLFQQAVVAAGFIGFREQDAIRTFALLADVALNPPLPPLVPTSALLAMEADSFSYDIYHPVGRLVSLLDNLARIGLYRGELDAEKMLAYEDLCCDGAGFPRLSEYRHQIGTLADEADSPLESSVHRIVPKLGVNEKQSAHYLIRAPTAWAIHSCWVQTKYWRHRGLLLPTWILGHGAHYAEEVAHTHFSDVDPERKWSQPPLYVVRDEDLHLRDPALGFLVVGSAAIAWSSFHITISGNSQLALDDYGPACYGFAAAGAFAAQLLCYFGLQALEMELKDEWKGG